MSATPSKTIAPAATPRIARARAALIVYRLIDGVPHFLLVSASNDPGKLTLPGGKIDRDENALQAAIRETAEEAGVLTDSPRPLGSYPHRKRGRRIHPTNTFLARFAGTLNEYEGRAVHWLTLDQLNNDRLNVRRAIRRQIDRAAATLREHRIAA